MGKTANHAGDDFGDSFRKGIAVRAVPQDAADSIGGLTKQAPLAAPEHLVDQWIIQRSFRNLNGQYPCRRQAHAQSIISSFQFRCHLVCGLTHAVISHLWNLIEMLGDKCRIAMCGHVVVCKGSSVIQGLTRGIPMGHSRCLLCVGYTTLRGKNSDWATVPNMAAAHGHFPIKL